MALPTKEAVLAFLNSLGSSSDEVYESLKARQVTGYRSGPKCPIEVVLTREFGMEFSVGLLTVGAWGAGERRLPAFAMPDPVADFIRYFDAKTAYQDLNRGE